MAAFFCEVFILIIVKPIIVDTIRGDRRSFLSLSISYIEPVNSIIVKDFCFLQVKQILRIVDDSCPWIHREFELPLLVIQRPIACLFHDVGQSTFGRHLLPLVQSALVHSVLLDGQQRIFVLLHHCRSLVLVLLVNCVFVVCN